MLIKANLRSIGHGPLFMCRKTPLVWASDRGNGYSAIATAPIIIVVTASVKKRMLLLPAIAIE